MSLAKKLLPCVVGTTLGLSIGAYLMTTSVVTESGYESVLMIKPPFLSAVYTGDADEEGKHRHLQFTYGIPVKKVQEFTEVGVELFTMDHKSVKADVRVTLKINDSSKLLRNDGESWYQKQVGMAVQGTAGLTGMGFSESVLLSGQDVDIGRFNILGMLKLQSVLNEKDVPVIVQNFNVVRVYR